MAGIDSQWDVDLMDMVDLAKQNDGYQYVVVAIDIFSRFAHCQPVKSKKGKDVVDALKRLLSGHRKPNMVRSDLGMEFRSVETNKYFKQQGIYHFYALNTETKANYSERLIKTLKHKLFRYMMKHRTQRYIDALQDIVYSYNHTRHRSLGKAPASINKVNEGESRLQQYLLRQNGIKSKKRSSKKTLRRYKFKLGQTVRLSHVRSLFDREYSQKWTGEIFKVKTRFRRDGIPVYTLESWDEESVDGTFYEPEMQAVVVDASTEYHIQAILKKRVRKKRKEVLVRWLHWPKKYDSWIPEEDVKDYS
ncbi:MAG: DDE-type integrase/transposase/recombinase [Candidatus Thiodiazotropha endolucinida]|nr:DDE-type integrase/transposase/recombinase [Candidatus Thiodiazotropha taylori]MCW4346759.1 DDE-type integrase/transposase/recombinase [Candidatus Thiodiazotropha endolucinida]